MGSLASDVYTKADFLAALLQAEENAKNAWEEEFVQSLREKYEDYGMAMFFSDAQKQTLDRIAYGVE